MRSRFLKTGDWRENSVNIPGANRRLAKDLQQAFPDCQVSVEDLLRRSTE
ncbi:MAG: hypothetical protein RIE73_33385 [Coleofasciculus sp. C1-SOL-03]